MGLAVRRLLRETWCSLGVLAVVGTVAFGLPAIDRAVPGTRADLKPGEYIFAGAQEAADGTITAPRIQVSKNGVRPPQ